MDTAATVRQRGDTGLFGAGVGTFLLVSAVLLPALRLPTNERRYGIKKKDPCHASPDAGRTIHHTA
jgi:hypothetical protein